jgi:gliding motility-associated lipoprotein GldH
MLSEKKSISLYTFFCFAACAVALLSCTAIDLYEKTVPVPKHEWSSAFKPEFRFDITDTAAPYQVFIILRHTDRYNYNNIWINLAIQAAGDTTQKVQYELPLASKEKGWLGTGMDDIYEHRINITPANENFYFKKSGAYVFTIEQIMREDPLQHVLDVGLRLEKKTP